MQADTSVPTVSASRAECKSPPGWAERDPPLSWHALRPAILFPLFADTATLSGVGPKLAQLMGKAAGTRIVDLLFHLPSGVIDRSWRPGLTRADEGRVATFTLNVLDHVARRDPRHPDR